MLPAPIPPPPFTCLSSEIGGFLFNFQNFTSFDLGPVIGHKLWNSNSTTIEIVIFGPKLGVLSYAQHSVIELKLPFGDKNMAV